MISTRTAISSLAAIAGVLLVIACGAGSTAKKATEPSPAAPVGATHTKSSSNAKAAGPKTLLNISGKGIKKSAIFKTADEWQVAYTYDCSSFYGGSGNFQVMQYSGAGDLQDILVNELDKKGGDTVPVHASAGAHYLEVNSECKWTLKVVG